jgi:hypothetical protein
MAWASGQPTGAACDHCEGHGREPGPTRDARGSGAVIAIGRGETAPSGANASHGHQLHQRVESDSWEGRAYPYPPRWRHACTAPHAAAIDLGAGQRVVGNLHG